jgi:transcriptional regulator with GAF, ATPase, and Fis domain
MGVPMSHHDLSIKQLTAEVKVAQQEIARLKSEINQHQERWLRYEKTVADISTSALASKDAKLFQQKCLERIGDALDLSRAYIFEHRHGSDIIDNTFEWVGPGVSPQKQDLQNLSANDAPWWTWMMKSNQIINCTNTEALPHEAERQILKNQQIKSVLAVPLFVRQEYHGFMGFDECRFEREWPLEDIALLKTVSEIMGMVIEREQDRHAIHEKEALLNATINSLPFDLFIIGKDGRYKMVNPVAARRWGGSNRETTGRNHQ